MGQYHRVANLDKHEYLNPHELGDGLKLLEQALSGPGGIPTAIHVLLAVSSGRGGGDYGDEHPLAECVVGRWGGDRIAIIGDYAGPNDIPGVNAEEIYGQCSPEGEYTNITELVRTYLEEGVDDYYEVFTYSGVGDGWADRTMDMKRRAGK